MHLLKKKKITLIIILATIFISILQPIIFIKAENSRSQTNLENLSVNDLLQITNGTYLDLDEDGFADDIITEFTVFSPTGEDMTIRMDFDFYLALPSGKTFVMSYKAIETFIELPTDIHWYNTAEEAGNYTFTVKAWLRGTFTNGERFSYRITKSLEFDPPEHIDSGRPFGLIIFY